MVWEVKRIECKKRVLIENISTLFLDFTYSVARGFPRARSPAGLRFRGPPPKCVDLGDPEGGRAGMCKLNRA